MTYNNGYNQNPYYGAFVQVQPQADIPWTQPLNKEEAATLKKKDPGFVLKSTEDEILKAKCTHRDPNLRKPTLVQTGERTYKCLQCGEEFNIVDAPEEEIEKYVSTIIDILQTTKMMYVNMPPQAVTAYFNMIPFLEKLPRLYKIAQDVFKRATGANTLQTYGNATGDVFAQLANSVGAGFGGYPYYQQQPQQTMYNPNMGYNPNMAPMGAPMGSPVMPAYNPQAVYPTTPGFYGDPTQNPIMAGGQQPQYYNNQQQTQAVPTVPAATVDQAPAVPQNQPQQQQQPNVGEQVVTNKQFSL